MSIQEQTPLLSISVTEKPPADPIVASTKKAPRLRLHALDIFRGATMVGMIIVDNQGSFDDVFPPFDETEWNGVSLADTVFPSFVFIMGMAGGLGWKPSSTKAKKFVTPFRIMGVLQRLGLVYLIVALLTLFCQHAVRRVWLVFMCAFYLSVMYFFKVPGCDRGDLSKQCNPGGYLDYQVLGAYMIHPTDPEGLFTTLTATVTSLLGFEFGLLYQNERGRILLSFILLTFAYWFQFVNPLNKKLWSVSFTFLCAGFSGCVLSFCALITDRLFQYLAPLKWLGTNPLVVFVGMVFYEVVLLDNIKMDDGRSAWDAWYQDWFASWIGAGQLASFLFSFVHVVFWVLVTGVMHYKKIFVKL